MSALKRLQDAATLVDVANLLGFQGKALGYLIRGQPEATRYTQFDIPKRSGGQRTISAPNKKLKLLQSRLAEILQKCVHEIEASRGLKRSVSHGFKPDHSILTNAVVHRGRRYVLNVDLHDFFGTINFGRVRGFLIKSRDFSLDPAVATIIAQIACYQNSLPQGSPCSPILSNLVANILDIRLAKLAKKYCCSYTRYADDLTFSTSAKNFPEELAIRAQVGPHVWEAGSELVRAIQASGFKLNPSKTRLQYGRSRQEVTGIVVNRRLNVSADYRRMARAMLHRLRKTGEFHVAAEQLEVTGLTAVVDKPGTMKQLQGRLSFIRAVDYAEHRRISKDKYPSKMLSVESMIKDFIYFKSFIAGDMPIIICEGKTDEIYLNEAIRSLGEDLPALVKKDGDDVALKVRIHKESEQSVRILKLSGGVCDLEKFLSSYSDEYKKVAAPKGAHPVVILIDSDAGGRRVIGGAKKYGVAPVGGKHYFHIVDNLYVLMTSPPGHESCMEDLFDDDARKKKIGIRSFNPDEKTFDSSIHYGKAWFSEKVVKRNSKNIDFSGFLPLLSELSTLISSHAQWMRPVSAQPNLPASVSTDAVCIPELETG